MAAERRAGIGLVQVTIAGYRRAFVDAVRSDPTTAVRIGCGDMHLETSVTRGIPDDCVDVRLVNRFLLGRRLVFQSGWRSVLADADTWVLELNPRIVNTWLALVLGRLRGRRTFVWGHFRGRRYGDDAPRIGRVLQIRLATGVLAYTEADADDFRQRFPRSTVVLVPNAIDRAADLPLPATGRRVHFVSIGRLAADKHVDLIVDGFAEAARTGLGEDVRLVVVGDGPARDDVVRAVERSGVANRIDLLAGTFDTEVLQSLYDRAIAAVCGGYVGLNITQSLSRGVPFVYPLRANHSPEVSLARPGENTSAFDPSTPSAVAGALLAAERAVAEGIVDHAAVQRQTVAVYSVEAMAAGFCSIAMGASA